METPRQTATRLLAALEDFAEQESVLLRSLAFNAAAALQQRAGPLVERLGRLATDPEVTALRPRVAALLTRREQNARLLEAQRARLESELRRLDEARARLARVAPVYLPAGGAPAAPRLNAAA
jgi:hypothetical protein